MQIVLSNNRVVGYGENFLCMGGTVINTATGAKYDNATIAECDCVPSDIGRVGYEYRSGSFVPSAPFGMADNTGYIMEVCTACATPRNSGVSIKNVKWGTIAQLNINESYNIGSSTNKGYAFNVSDDFIKDYTEYRIVLKAGSSFELANKPGMGQNSAHLEAPGISAMKYYNSPTLSAEIEHDCIAEVGFLPSTFIFYDGEEHRFEVQNGWRTINLEFEYTLATVNLTYELQVRG